MNKADLKKQYKQTLPPMGIYQIKNLTNGKILIGKTKNLTARQNRFEFEMNFGGDPQSEIYADYKKYGKENFAYNILDTLKPVEDPAYKYDKDLEVLEDLWLEKLQPYGEKGYNEKKPE
ncbi:MAG TPA: GIY-YIG nuclease family protein [Ignavibacteriaceae bacterium]|nr:GIY-YIG nuclease family protein [Ignavibacteriaceae bacterium]